MPQSRRGCPGTWNALWPDCPRAHRTCALPKAGLINVKFRRDLLGLYLTSSSIDAGDPILEMGKLSQERRQWSHRLL